MSKQIVKWIASPANDDQLEPSEFRVYYNHLIVQFIFFSIIFCFIFSFIFFIGDLNPYLTFWKLFKKDEYYLSLVNTAIFYPKLYSSMVVGCLVSGILTSFLKKPIQRQLVVAGNFLDDSPFALKNLAIELQAQKTDNTNISIFKSNELDLNSRKVFKKDIQLSNSILERGFIVIGEAGAGKTTILDRLNKEFIDKKNKLIIHDATGEEQIKYKSYTKCIIIEPWKKGTYSIDFCKLLNKSDSNLQDALIQVFVKAFSPKSIDFWGQSAEQVSFAVIKKVMTEKLSKAKLLDFPSTWANLIATESTKNLRSILVQFNPSQASLIDVENPKTSSSIISSCSKTFKNLEELGKFWSNSTKQFDIEKWITTDNTKEKSFRNTVILANSNIYSDVATAYISAFINLFTKLVIDPSYQKYNPIFLSIDEFPQLPGIDIQSFLKLPDVGRKKGIRVLIAMQRASQIKLAFNTEYSTVVGAFQNKIWTKFDLSNDGNLLLNEAGKQELRVYKTTSNYTTNKDGKLFKQIKVEPLREERFVLNPADLQKELGPIENSKKEFVGVRFLLNLHKIKRLSVITLAPVSFPARYKSRPAPQPIPTPQLPTATAPKPVLEPSKPIPEPQATTCQVEPITFEGKGAFSFTEETEEEQKNKLIEDDKIKSILKKLKGAKNDNNGSSK